MYLVIYIRNLIIYLDMISFIETKNSTIPIVLNNTKLCINQMLVTV